MVPFSPFPGISLKNNVKISQGKMRIKIIFFTVINLQNMQIINLKYADDTTLMAGSEEELKSLLMKVKVESEKVGSTFRKRRSWHLVPSLHGK